MSCWNTLVSCKVLNMSCDCSKVKIRCWAKFVLFQAEIGNSTLIFGIYCVANNYFAIMAELIGINLHCLPALACLLGNLTSMVSL